MNKFSNLFNKVSHKNDYEIAVISRPNSSYAESFRKIPLDIKFSQLDKDLKVIQITSSVAGENKTTTALNLAAVYQELQKKVVVVDCDLRKPKIHRATKILNENGLTDFLADKIDYQALIKKTNYGFDVVNSGDTVAFPHVILRSEKFRNFIEKLKKEYDFVILDCPPILLVTDSLVITEVADTTLFVINQKLTKKSDTIEAIKLLKDAKAHIAGIVLSNVNRSISNYHRYEKYY